MELSPPTVIRSILPLGAGRHVVCAPQHPAEHSRCAGPHCSAALGPQREPPGPLIVLDSQRGGLDRIRELLEWIVGRRECRSDRGRLLVFFRGTPSAANSAPKLSSLRGQAPQSEPREPLTLSARQWGGLGVHCISGLTGVGIASRSLTERLLLPLASGHAP
ncbi:hypothetical protein NDU88_002597 [Pleurodeles waltl]|uniref:Uncharacterized protein n=1 Tax=Pleurodeles waltl TaxID=8319 RepID=A0AAV7MQ48_PLEWA|nr:hypothetical protein NDU88_002597 [Pleurodeles waltl]